MRVREASRLLALACSATLFLIAAVPSSARPTDGALATHEANLIRLGQRLFGDDSLSSDSRTSCAACHKPSHAYADDRPVSTGIRGQRGSRNAPSLATIGRTPPASYFWDGRRETLTKAVMDPFVNPKELGLKDDGALLRKIERQPAYQKAFAEVFGTDQVSRDQVALALAAFVRSLDTGTSRYDKYVRTGDITLLDGNAQLGLKLFQGKAHCIECHSLDGQPTEFTDHRYHRTGVGMGEVANELPLLTQQVLERDAKGNALGAMIMTSPALAQLGRFNVTHQPQDIGLFRTPSLRHVSMTAPYMHDGTVPTLDEAIDREVYYRSLQTGHPMHLTQEERSALKAFLLDI